MIVAFIRTILIYLFLVAAIRLMGKRQVGELEPSELVLAMLLSDLASVPMQDFGIPLLSGLIPIVTILSITMIFSVLTMKNLRVRKLLCGTPTVVLANGKVLPHAMNKVRMTVDELAEELRLQGVTAFSTVKYAILETSGQVSVILYQAEEPPTAQMMQVPAQETGLPLVLISDGQIMEDNLKHSGKNDVWLMRQLEQNGCRRPDQVFLFTVDEQDTVYLILKEETDL
ncbi:MAG: DUF421 domain-containing protein [Oscillospiraceae bacterium]|nr:DUF421 domain-containing protein [Oscillospiraceae bacterium]